jgi:hypothetical protein
MVTGGLTHKVFVIMFDAAGCKLNIGDKWVNPRVQSNQRRPVNHI